MTARCALIGAGVGLLLVAGYVALALWADDRNTRFYQATEPRNWIG
jgi:hypothetical protein